MLTFRFATGEDAPLVLDFIKRLAEFEKLSAEVVATQEDIRKSLSGDKPECEVLLAYADLKPAGFALFFHNYSTFLGKKGLYLEDLFVLPEMRGAGIGKRMLEELAQIALKRDCKRFEWCVLNWNKDAIRFYERIGAKPMDEWTTFRIDEKTMRDFSNK